ncbi:putative MFS family arabinose efflux permease [Kribbella rubisoli]|uniref:MFS family arabinose efflux permease n=1 Tax=Kribbella rubisoli TaxID=3075929 RepID=A0A4Q7WLL2_9ACTN|nr:MFS transporter [Kribbella rubisoli]RZU10974.1 putative MFS family arabinose efflux permease [Kribbella rubisoli]
MTVPVRRLWVAVLFGYLAFGATLQALPSYVPEKFGGGALASGTAVGIAFLATACGRPFAGRLADAGRSRPVVLTGGVLAAIGGLGQLLAPDLGLLLVARLVMGAGEAALFSAALPWVLSGARVAQRGRLAGWFGLSMWGGLAAGPVIATLVGAKVWWAVVGLSLASAALVLTTPSDPGRLEPLARIRHPRDLVPAGVPLPGATIGLAAYCYGTVAALLVLRLRADNLDVDNIALAVFAAGFLVTRFAGSPLVDRFGGRSVAATTVTLEIVALVGLALAIDSGTAITFTALAGVGLALIYPACVSMTLDRVRGLRPGVSMGVMTSFWDLGVMAAGPLGGLIAEWAGYQQAFLVAAGAGLACVLVALRVPSRGVSPR